MPVAGGATIVAGGAFGARPGALPWGTCVASGGAGFTVAAGAGGPPAGGGGVQLRVTSLMTRGCSLTYLSAAAMSPRK